MVPCEVWLGTRQPVTLQEGVPTTPGLCSPSLQALSHLHLPPSALQAPPPCPQRSPTHGFPDVPTCMPAANPGTRMWGCGSYPTCRGQQVRAAPTLRDPPPKPPGKRLTHQRGPPIAAGSHGGRGPVELRGHEVQAGVGTGPGHVPIDGRVSHAEGGRIRALHSQWVPQAQGCPWRGSVKGWGPGSILVGISARSHPPQALAGPSSPSGSTGPLAAVGRNCWALLEPGAVASPWEVGVLDFRLGVPAFSTCQKRGEI